MAIHKLKIFAGSGSHELAAKIAESYGCELGDLSVSRFSDGEFQPAFEESIRGCTVFIFCRTTATPAFSVAVQPYLNDNTPLSNSDGSLPPYCIVSRYTVPRSASSE